MHEWDFLCRLIALFIGTGFVRGLPAQSLLIVGQPGSGKSSAIRRFRTVRTCHVVSDLTVDPLRRVILPLVRDKGYRHLLFPDFWKLFQRKDHAVGNVVGLLSAAMSGELEHSYVGPLVDHGDVQLGIIGAMPTLIFREWARTMEAQGILDRVLTIYWDFSPEEVARIEHLIAEANEADLILFPFPEIPEARAVQWDAAVMGPAVVALVDRVRKKDRNRLIGVVRGLTMAAALLRAVSNGKLGAIRAGGEALAVVADYEPWLRAAR